MAPTSWSPWRYLICAAATLLGVFAGPVGELFEGGDAARRRAAEQLGDLARRLHLTAWRIS